MSTGLADHLWQTTVYALFAGFFAAACRRNHASVRYWLWFSASVKFLIPFTLLISLGSHLGRMSAPRQLVAPATSSTMVQIGEPFTGAWPGGMPQMFSTSATSNWLGVALLAVWFCGFLAIALIRLQTWRSIEAAMRAS